MMMEMGGILMILSSLLFVLLFILWLVLPFLIMGTNNRLNRIIALLQHNNAMQREQLEYLRNTAVPTDEPPTD